MEQEEACICKYCDIKDCKNKIVAKKEDRPTTRKVILSGMIQTAREEAIYYDLREFVLLSLKERLDANIQFRLFGSGLKSIDGHLQDVKDNQKRSIIELEALKSIRDRRDINSPVNRELVDSLPKIAIKLKD